MKLIQKNKTKTDCGVVAAFNAAQLCKIRKQYKTVAKTAASCGYSEKRGIFNFQFSWLLKKLNVPAKKVRHQSLEHLEEDLYKGKFFLILYRRAGTQVGHVVLTFIDQERRIRIINPERKRVTWRSLASEIKENGMVEFHTYEISRRAIFGNGPGQ